jgi:hypothetical protein
MKAKIAEQEKELKEWHRRAPDVENMEATIQAVKDKM